MAECWQFVAGTVEHSVSIQNSHKLYDATHVQPAGQVQSAFFYLGTSNEGPLKVRLVRLTKIPKQQTPRSCRYRNLKCTGPSSQKKMSNNNQQKRSMYA